MLISRAYLYTAYAALAKELLELPELSTFDARKGSKDYKLIYSKVRDFFHHKRQTSEQLRAANMKYRSKEGRAARLQPAARLRIIYLD